jgi:uncharacterized protein (DUF1778 family)
MAAGEVRNRARAKRDVTINLRAPETLRTIIDRAASVVGKSRSEFMLESARRQAEDVLLDQSFFVLDEAKYGAFLRLLDAPAPPNAALRKLLKQGPPWRG